MLELLAPYRKTLVAILGAFITWAVTYKVADPQWLALLTMVATAAGVYAVPNKAGE